MERQQTTTNEIRALATEYVQASGEKRFDRLAELLHPELEARRPSGNMLGKEGYLDGTRRLALILLRNEIRRIFVNGDEAVVFYDMVTDSPAGAVLTSEWLTFADGRVRSSVLLLDGQHWPEALAELERRVASVAASSDDD